MLIDGNYERGIDVGLMSREGFSLGMMRIEGAPEQQVSARVAGHINNAEGLELGSASAGLRHAFIP
ncbi:hypothetical protein [Blastomonas sp.]|uniref:hypothetical protein n=1 Tax=Blastomonas sp. TaxID=1909299 RepID=UPI00406A19B6